ncbi:MAG: fcl [Candidatus Saccharibacteria bacterium]|nr:fcl [Candidatus Saccharibacteria bacterium]
MEKILIGRNGFLSQAMQRADGDLIVVGSADFDLLNDEPKALESIDGADILFDTADFYPGVKVTSENPVEVYEKNVQMYETLFALARANNIGKVVTIGTTGCYPITDELLREDLFNGDASKLNQKLVSYALSRFTLLDIAALYRGNFGIEHSHLVLPNFYGPGDRYEMGRSHLLASWVRDFQTAKETGQDEIELWGPPTQRREFIYIDDAARYTLALGQMTLAEEVINVGTGTTPTYKEMADTILKVLGFDGKLKWDLDKPVARNQEVMDTSVMQRYAVDLPAPTDFQQGVKLTVEDYLNDRAS